MKSRVYCFITGENYRWLLEPYLYFHDKYWGDPVTVVTDLNISVPSKHTIFKMPSYCKHFYKDNMGQMIKEVTNSFPEPLVVISLPDFWPCRPVDTVKMRNLEDFIVQNGSIARTCLWRIESVESQQNDIVGYTSDGMLVNRISPMCSHFGQLGATSGLLATWDKRFLNQAYLDHWTWADWELKGQHIMATAWEADGKKMKPEGGQWGSWYSTSTNPLLVDINHVCFTSKRELADLSALFDEDKEYAKKFVPPNYEIML